MMRQGGEYVLKFQTDPQIVHGITRVVDQGCLRVKDILMIIYLQIQKSREIYPAREIKANYGQRVRFCGFSGFQDV